MSDPGRVPWYGVSHLVPLAVFLVGLVGCVWLGRRDRATPGPTTTSRVWALAIPAVTVPFQIYDAAANFDVDVTLPLHLCDLAWVAAAFALWTHHPYPVALTYLWGVVLTVQAIVTPSLGEDFAHPRYFAFWALHVLIVWAAVYLVFGLRLAPRWRDYGAVVGTTLAWVVVTYAFNLVADTNYGYLMEKPGSSILDLFGPWPWYVVVEIVLVSAVWALLTLLAQRVARGVRHPSRGSHRRRARSLPS
jgi:hypothetical integral membrane protein (TIGR02206 family)